MPSMAARFSAQGDAERENLSAKELISVLKEVERTAILKDGDYMSYLLARLRLTSHKVLLTVIPLVILTVVVRLAIQLGTRGDFDTNGGEGFQGIFAAETVTPFTTASMFVIALMLSGVLDDYKEAEKIPADMVCAIDSLSEKVCFVDFCVERRMRELAEEHEEEARELAHAQHKGGAKAEEVEGIVARYFKKQLAEEEKKRDFKSAEIHTELLRYMECLCVGAPCSSPLPILPSPCAQASPPPPLPPPLPPHFS